MAEEEITLDNVEESVVALGLTENQQSFAESLSLNLQTAQSISDVMQQIEGSLGQRNIHELTRWFMLSVYRHTKRKKWTEPSEFDLSPEQQSELISRLVEKDDFKQSILTVLKDLRCRYTLLSFGKSRDPARQTLSNATKAFKQTQQVLRDAELLPAKKERKPQYTSDSVGSRTALSETEDSVKQQTAATAHNRRAARRGFVAESPWEAPPLADNDAEDDNLSEEEFALLDEALKDSSKGSAQRWTYNTNEERLSLLSGVLAGAAACMLLLWIIY